jgi:hypothetical protein
MAQIPQPNLSQDKIRFSFEFYDTDRNDYCLSAWEQNQIRETLGRLKQVNTKSFQELNKDRRVMHFGEVDWGKTTEHRGFNNPTLALLPPFHFALLGVNGQKARVFGAYAGGVFYIVWFDLEHVIWPSFLKNT